MKTALTFLFLVSPFAPAEETKPLPQLPDGYSLELVASESFLTSPVLCVWDGNGRMYVAQWQSDLNNPGSEKGTSSVIRLEDTNDDGLMDKRTVFANNLVLPRMILPLDDQILIGESNTSDIFAYHDTDDDGLADEKTLWHQGRPREGHIFEQSSGLIWAMDNWIYTTRNGFRFRFTNREITKENTLPNRGQWGLTQDNYGKVIFCEAKSGSGPIHWLFPHTYTDWSPDWATEDGFRKIPPSTSFTAPCGQAVFRGDRLPPNLQGNLIFSDSKARIIRRAHIDYDAMGRPKMRNFYPGSEFLRSTDPNFQPVNAATGPDGTLYLVDLQESRAPNASKGRIYRLRHKDFQPGPRPDMLNESPAQLTNHLAHPNGWWRDEAQKLLILKNDRSVIPSLKKIFVTHKNSLARLHALWTLEGLEAIEPDIMKAAFDDTDPHIRAAMIRIFEPYFLAESDALLSLTDLTQDQAHQVQTQLLLSLSRKPGEMSRSFANSVLANNPDNTFLRELDQQLTQQALGN